MPQGFYLGLLLCLNGAQHCRKKGNTYTRWHFKVYPVIPASRRNLPMSSGISLKNRAFADEFGHFT